MILKSAYFKDEEISITLELGIDWEKPRAYFTVSNTIYGYNKRECVDFADAVDNFESLCDLAKIVINERKEQRRVRLN